MLIPFPFDPRISQAIAFHFALIKGKYDNVTLKVIVLEYVCVPCLERHDLFCLL